MLSQLNRHEALIVNVRFREAKKLSSNKSVATFATEILSAPLFVVVICKSSLHHHFGINIFKTIKLGSPASPNTSSLPSSLTTIPFFAFPVKD